MAYLTSDLRRQFIASRRRLIYTLDQRIAANRELLNAPLENKAARQTMLDILLGEKIRLESEIVALQNPA